jgi:YgiT-type zinc finger domain-containing protein
MICDICGQNSAQIRYVTRSYGSGENLLIIENIPIVSCSHCGETYLTAKTLHEIERIKIHRDGFAHKQPVPVAVFSEAV